MDSRLSSQCETFVADRDLDNDKIRKQLHERDILAVIDTRNLWEEVNSDPDQLKVPTLSLDADVYDTMLRTECGNLYRRCPESRPIRPMHYQGYEKKRGALKWVCPAAAFEFDCEGPGRMPSAGPGRSQRQVKGGVNQSGLRQSSPAPGIAASDFEVEASLPQKKRHGAHQFQGGRWLHAAQPLFARQTVDGTEDHRLHDGDAGGGQFRDAIERARIDPVTGAVASGLIRPLRGRGFIFQ